MDENNPITHVGVFLSSTRANDFHDITNFTLSGMIPGYLKDVITPKPTSSPTVYQPPCVKFVEHARTDTEVSLSSTSSTDNELELFVLVAHRRFLTYRNGNSLINNVIVDSTHDLQCVLPATTPCGHCV